MININFQFQVIDNLSGAISLTLNAKLVLVQLNVNNLRDNFYKGQFFYISIKEPFHQDSSLKTHNIHFG